MKTISRADTATGQKSSAWLYSRTPSLIGADLTISLPDGAAGSIYNAKILAADEGRLKINLPRRIAGQGYLRESGAVIVNFIVDDTLYEALGEYHASDEKVRSITINGAILPATRRRYARLPLQITVDYAAVSDVTLTGGRLANVAWRQCRALDISGSGILIQTPVQAPIGSYLLINLQIDSFDGPVYAFGQVRWSGISDTGRRLFQCGVMFIAAEELSIHFSPAAMTAIPSIMRQFNRNTRDELDAFLIGLSGGLNKGEYDVTQ
ncbi:MAG: PilZ domain-containing protein [bacterium]